MTWVGGGVGGWTEKDDQCLKAFITIGKFLVEFFVTVHIYSLFHEVFSIYMVINIFGEISLISFHFTFQSRGRFNTVIAEKTSFFASGVS